MADTRMPQDRAEALAKELLAAYLASGSVKLLTAERAGDWIGHAYLSLVDRLRTGRKETPARGR